MSNSASNPKIKDEIADLAKAAKAAKALRSPDEIQKEKNEAIAVLKSNVENKSNKDVLEAIKSATNDETEQKFLVEILGIDWEKLKGAEENAKEFVCAEVQKELIDLKAEAKVKAVSNVEAKPFDPDDSTKQLAAGIYLFPDFGKFKEAVEDDLKAIQKIKTGEEGKKDGKSKEVLAKWADKMEADDPLTNRLSKMFPEEFAKKEWAAIKTKLNTLDFQKEWKTKHKAIKYKEGPNAEFQEKLATIPRCEYEKDDNDGLVYSENAKAYVEALKAGFQGTYEEYRELMPKSKMDEWGDKIKGFGDFLGNMMEKFFGPSSFFRKMLGKMGVDFDWLDSLGTKGKKDKIDALNKKENEEYYAEESLPEVTEVEKKLNATRSKVKTDNMERMSPEDRKKIKVIVEKNAGTINVLGAVIQEGEFSIQYLLNLKGLIEKDGYDFIMEKDPKDSSKIQFFKVRQLTSNEVEKTPIDLTDDDIFRKTVAKEEVTIVKGSPAVGLKVSGVGEKPLVFNNVVEEYYDPNKTAEGNKADMRNALTSEVVRKMLSDINTKPDVAEELANDAGDLPLSVLQDLAKMDHIEMDEASFFNWRDLKVRFAEEGQWYTFDTFEQLGKVVKGFEKEEKLPEDEKKMKKLAEEMKLSVENLKDILDVDKKDYFLFKNKNMGMGLKIMQIGFIDAARFRVWINSDKGKTFMDSDQSTLRKHLGLKEVETKPKEVVLNNEKTFLDIDDLGV
jgi:hypothetical protein